MHPFVEQSWPIGRALLLMVGDVEDPQGRGGFRDRISGDFVNNATGVIDLLQDADTGAAITGVTLPISATYLAGSEGVYWCEIPGTAVVQEGQRVIGRMVLTTGGKANPFWFRFFGELP